jgi:hypothetical protein
MQIDSKSSFLCFIYPFQFKNEYFGSYCDSIDHTQWYGRNGPMDIWKKQKFPDDELLKHVSRYLNPPEISPKRLDCGL